MNKELALIMVLMILVGILSVPFNVQRAKASGTVYVRADGSIDPPDSPITTLDNMTYTLIGNITSSVDGVVVERDNIVVDGAGYTIQGTDGEAGIYLSCRSNVTIENISIRGFDSGVNLTSSFSNSIVENEIAENGFGITLYNSSSNTIAENNMIGNYHLGIDLSESSDNNLSRNNMVSNDYVFRLFFSSRNSICRNNITDNNRGIWLFESSNNIVSLNKIIANVYYGIMLDSSSNNIVSQNDIEEHTYQGIHLYDSSSNSIFGNNIVNNLNYGIWIDISSWNNSLFHNNFINNTRQVALFFPQTVSVSWDGGYPSGGNYWSNYTGVDMKNGLYQNETGGDGIGDVPHVVGPANMDNYPLMHPWSSLPAHNMNTGLGYDTIQGAIDANETIDGHVIFVEAGTYYENVLVNKTVSLVGESRENTLVDGDGTGSVISITTNNVVIDGFTVSSSGSDAVFEHSCGVYVDEVLNVTIKNNEITDNKHGIGFWESSNGVVSGNDVSNNVDGIYLWYSSNNMISGNNITSHTLYDGIYLSESSSNVVSGNNIASNGYGIHLYESSNCTVSGNNIANNMYGIYLGWGSSNNVFSENLVTNNSWGIDFYSSSNMVFHNNFINNVNRTDSPYLNVWDEGYPSAGNYWSDYTGVDADNDGIGDEPHTIDANNADRYPLMGMFYGFNVSWIEPGYDVELISNSSVSAFDVGFWIEHPEDPNTRTIKFNVTGETGTAGFCRVCIPTALLNATYTVLLNGTEIPCTLLPCSNTTHSYLYFNYTHSTEEVIIIPEFPSFLILSLFMILSMLALTFANRRFRRKPER